MSKVKIISILSHTCTYVQLHRQRTSNMRTSVLSYDIQSQNRRPVEITELFCYCLKYLVAEDRNFRRTGFLVDSTLKVSSLKFSKYYKPTNMMIILYYNLSFLPHGFTNPEFWIFKNVFCCCFLSKQARLSLVGSEFEIEN